MSDQSPGHVPPPPPTVPQASPSVPYAQDEAARPSRAKRTWTWVVLAIVIAIGAVMTNCMIPVLLLSSGPHDGLGEGSESVGVIHVDGVIAGTSSGLQGFVTPESFRDLLDQARENDSVKAVVLRVDSPGGTVAASEEIAAYAREFEKPLVVSIGDVGASGAYMLASQTDEIWAMPGSTVGSIGVITDIPNASGLLEKLGVEFQVITAGKYKDAGSPYRPLTDEERALIQGEIDEAYEQFIGIVAQGRDMPESEVRALATGWAWSGDRAKELGLIDEIGTLEQALDSAAARGGIKGDYEVVEIGPDQYEQLFESVLGVTRRLDRLGAIAETRESSLYQTLPR